MNDFQKFGAVFIENDKKIIVNDTLTVEAPLEIRTNGIAYTVTMRTPNNDVDLINGLLFAENVIYNSIKSAPIINLDCIPNIAYVIIPDSEIGKGIESARNQTSVSSCGICGKTSFENIDDCLDVNPNLEFGTSLITQAFSKMDAHQFEFHKTGGSHAAAAFTKDGNLLVLREDIGRHNAVDKVIGYVLANDLLNEVVLLTVSGRVSYEIVQKAHHAKIPILAAVSAPSSYAVEKAEELGITLLAFCRNKRMTVYSHQNRLKITAGLTLSSTYEA